MKISEKSRLEFFFAPLRLCARWILAKAQSRKVQITMAPLLLAVISLSVFLAHSYRSYAKIVDARLAHGYLTSRAGIYAAPRTLRAGQKLSPDGLAAALRRAGYVESDDASEVWNGSFSVADATVEIRPNNTDGYPSVVRVAFDPAGRIVELSGDEISLDSFTLAPESITNDAVMKSGARSQLAFKDIPRVLVQAITSIEDRRFFDHHGLDVFGVVRALLRNAGDERMGQGGSTITQQLIKNTYLTPERTLRRKYAEAMLAFTLERRLSKEDIFALYCNEIYLGQRGVVAVRGVDQAARVFFGKELKDLSLPEAATIAGMIQSPARYSPVRHGDATRSRRDTVLGTMVRDGFISLNQATVAANEPLTLADFDPARESVAPYFVDYVNRISEARASSRAPFATEPLVTGNEEAGKLPVPTVTTLDLDLQHIATQAVQHQLDHLDKIYKPRGLTPQVALVALDPRTGNVLAMVGGRDYGESQLNRATDARRQPGSVFKPFVYAAALESGMSPLRMFKDAPQEFTYDQKLKYRPSNYGGGFSMRDVTMRTGLIKSLNVVTVDVAIQTGLARVANTAQRFGLPRPNPYPALALGTTEATPLQMAVAYAAFANGGRSVQPKVIAEPDQAPQGDQIAQQIIQPASAYVITDMLEGVIDHGTARAARGTIENTAIAGKTGTSRDGWFIGYTPNLVCAVWIGFDDNKQLGLTGAEAALPLWTDFVKNAVDLRPELGGKSFAQPDGVTIVEIDPETEELATGLCPQHELVAIASAQAPTSECFRHSIYFALPDDPKQEVPALAGSETPRSNKPRQKYSLGEFALLRDTHIETDKRGRSVLVNEMKVGGR
jgi:penicillin-binding protein 1B